MSTDSNGGRSSRQECNKTVPAPLGRSNSDDDEEDEKKSSVKFLKKEES